MTAEIKIFSDDVPLNFTLLRIKDNIKWNQPGARNLGVSFSKSERIIVSDLDIIFPENLLESLIYFIPPRNAIFKFRTFAQMKEIQPHFNVFFMYKDVFDKTNGVDEEFCGHYGHDDTHFYFLHKALGTKFYRYSVSNIVHKEHKEVEATQHNKLIRDTTHNEAILRRKLDVIESEDGDPMSTRSDLYLNFDWEFVKEHSIEYGI